MAEKAPKAKKGSNREYLIKKLLGESSRRISQKDRVRLREIVGLPPEPALKKGGAVKRKTGGTVRRARGGTAKKK